MSLSFWIRFISHFKKRISMFVTGQSFKFFLFDSRFQFFFSILLSLLLLSCLFFLETCWCLKRFRSHPPSNLKMFAIGQKSCPIWNIHIIPILCRGLVLTSSLSMLAIKIPSNDFVTITDHLRLSLSPQTILLSTIQIFLDYQHLRRPIFFSFLLSVVQLDFELSFHLLFSLVGD